MSILKTLFFIFILESGFYIVSAQGNLSGIRSIGYYKQLSSQPDTIWYKKMGSVKLHMLVMQPVRKRKTQKCPVMVWIHGGAWVAGSPEGYIPHLRFSTDQGAVGISIEYRLISKSGNNVESESGYTIWDCLADCKDAIRYIRQHADELGIDPDKIIVIGDSAGGHLALCLGTMNLPKDTRANAVINCNGISDLTEEKWIKYIQPGTNRLKTAKQLSPIYSLDNKAVSILTMNGADDKVVTPQEAERFFNACKERGIDTEYILWPGMRHAFIVTNYTATEEQTDKALSAMLNFLVKRRFLFLN
ncbi:MAG: alpha/beta hydrolase [Bacteroidota bacterium]|nr:alpha/beta hydrolase [Bacteroidota bacterium]